MKLREGSKKNSLEAHGAKKSKKFGKTMFTFHVIAENRKSQMMMKKRKMKMKKKIDGEKKGKGREEEGEEETI